MRGSNDVQDERLSLIARRIGLAIWHCQELEGVAAQYLVLMTQAKKGMGSEAGIALLEPVQSLPFGVMLKKIRKAGLLEADLETRFNNILSERNWLVHRSRGTNRDALFSDSGLNKVVSRVDAMAEEALSLLQVLGAKIEGYVMDQGVSAEDIDKRASALLEQWHASGEI